MRGHQTGTVRECDSGGAAVAAGETAAGRDLPVSAEREEPEKRSPSVLVSLQDAVQPGQLIDRLRERGLSDVTQGPWDFRPAGRHGSAHGSVGGREDFDAVLAGVPGDGTSLASKLGSARKSGFKGLIVAVLAEEEAASAAGLTRSGADHVMVLPARDVDIDILAEKILDHRSKAHSHWDILIGMLEPVEQGIVLIDGAGELVFANGSAKNALRAGDGEQIASAIAATCGEKVFEKSRSNGSAVTYADIPGGKGEPQRMLGLEVLFMRDAPGGGAHLVLLHDFSRFRRLDELRSKFATSLSHRMRTPLTSIRNAVNLLEENRCGGCGKERERLIDIGCRNVEKLISNLDDLQKIFMIESEELSVCRTMIGLRGELASIFDESREAGRIRDFKLSAADMMVFAGKGRLRDFFVSALEAYDVWLSEKPFIECSTSVREEYDAAGQPSRKIVIYLRPRATGSRRVCRESLREFLSLDEAHRGLVLGRLAAALDAEFDISTGNTVSLTLPLDPAFSREKDLVHPLHMMIERADIKGSEFSLIDLSMNEHGRGDPAAVDMMQKVLSAHLGPDIVVSLGERRGDWSVFINDLGRDSVEALMAGIRREFLGRCHDAGVAIYPSVRWETRYGRGAGVAGSPLESITTD